MDIEASAREAKRVGRIETLRLIADDAEQDAYNLDGEPLTGELLGRRFGEVYAMIHSIALIVAAEIEANDGS